MKNNNLPEAFIIAYKAGLFVFLIFVVYGFWFKWVSFLFLAFPLSVITFMFVFSEHTKWR